MNAFEKQIAGVDDDGLLSLDIDTLQVNMGLRCNQQCIHCHLEASPRQREMMEWPTMQLIVAAYYLGLSPALIHRFARRNR
jgi:sulfatase maturation enzyme AslB (radical SAM superfamily)